MNLLTADRDSYWPLLLAVIFVLVLSTAIVRFVFTDSNEIPAADGLVLARALEEYRVVHIYFFDSRLPECRKMSTHLRQIYVEGDLPLFKISVRDHPSLARQWRVSRTPLLLTFHHGQPVNAAVGLLSEEELAEFLTISYSLSP